MNEDRNDEWFDAQHVRNFLFEQLTRHAAKPAGDLSKLATALRVTGEQCEWEPAAEYAEKTADQLQRVAGFITDENAERLLRRLRRFALRNPALFIGGALLAGLGGGRFLRSSVPSDAQGQSPTPPADDHRSDQAGRARRKKRRAGAQRSESTTERTRKAS